MPLSTNTYGKSRIRLVKVRRNAGMTDFVEWIINILFEGSYETSYERGDNTLVLPTDTMKNTVYSLARSSPAACLEEFAIELCTHFLQHNPETSQVTIEIAQKAWERLTIGDAADPSCFHLAGNELQTTTVRGSRVQLHIQSGLRDLYIMKSAHSGFSGFKRDNLTTLKETNDRLLGTALTAEWTHSPGTQTFPILRRAIREKLLTTFAAHHSLSVQHTLFAMGQAVLDSTPEVTKIKLAMPNLHCLLVDLTPFGQDNPNEVFVPVDEPHGYIEAELTRT